MDFVGISFLFVVGAFIIGQVNCNPYKITRITSNTTNEEAEQGKDLSHMSDDTLKSECETANSLIELKTDDDDNSVSAGGGAGKYNIFVTDDPDSEQPRIMNGANCTGDPVSFFMMFQADPTTGEDEHYVFIMENLYDTFVREMIQSEHENGDY